MTLSIDVAEKKGGKGRFSIMRPCETLSLKIWTCEKVETRNPIRPVKAFHQDRWKNDNIQQKPLSIFNRSVTTEAWQYSTEAVKHAKIYSNDSIKISLKNENFMPLLTDNCTYIFGNIQWFVYPCHKINSPAK